MNLEVVSTLIEIPPPRRGAVAKDGQIVHVDRPGAYWFVSVETDDSAWTESFDTKPECDAFLRGLKAASHMLGQEEPKAIERTAPAV